MAVLGNGARFEREGELHRQRAVALLTANNGVPLPDYARRRAIVLGTDPRAPAASWPGSRSLAGELDVLRRAG